MNRKLDQYDEGEIKQLFNLALDFIAKKKLSKQWVAYAKKAQQEIKAERSDRCPCCKKGILEIDEEYMQGTYGAGWEHVPRKDQTVFCPHCEEAGTRKELTEKAK